MKDPYMILGISSNATDEEVKSAYRSLARKYHPDNYGDDNPLKDLANEKMQEINAAYDEIQRMRSSKGSTYKGDGTYYQSYSGTGSTSGVYADIRRCLNAKKFFEAERAIEQNQKKAQQMLESARASSNFIFAQLEKAKKAK